MKVFIYEDYSELVDFFGLPPNEVPFLGSTLVDFTINALTSQCSLLLGEGEPEIFYPESWGRDNSFSGDYTPLLSEEPELVLVTTSSSILVGTISRDDLQYVKERPNHLFYNGLVYIGYISRNGLKVPTNDDSLMSGFRSVTSLEGFLRLNQALVSRLSYPYDYDLDDSDIYGSPVILSESIHNSTICGPAFIGENVHISNSYIGPGTVIAGNTNIVNSRVYSSFVFDSSLSSISRLENSLIGGSSVVSGMPELADSRLPSGSKVVGSKG